MEVGVVEEVRRNCFPTIPQPLNKERWNVLNFLLQKTKEAVPLADEPLSPVSVSENDALVPAADMGLEVQSNLAAEATGETTDKNNQIEDVFSNVDGKKSPSVVGSAAGAVGGRTFIYSADSPSNSTVSGGSDSRSSSHIFCGEDVKVAGATAPPSAPARPGAPKQALVTSASISNVVNKADDVHADSDAEEEEEAMKISFMNFKAGSVALFVPIDATKKVWMAFHSNKPNRFLAQVLCIQRVFDLYQHL